MHWGNIGSANGLVLLFLETNELIWLPSPMLNTSKISHLPDLQNVRFFKASYYDYTAYMDYMDPDVLCP